MSSSPESSPSPLDCLSATCARAALPPLTVEVALGHLRNRGVHMDNAEEEATLFAHYLVARGDFQGLVSYLDAWEPEARARIVDTPHYETYFGNTLHTCAYWNTGHDALAIYRYLVSCGATAFKDYYHNYPWQVDGVMWPCPVRGYRVGNRHAGAEEFAETQAEIERYFGLTEPAAGPASAT